MCVWACVCIFVCAVSRAFDAVAGACLMWLLAGGGCVSVEPPALVLSTLPWPKAPPANLKGPKESPLNPLMLNTPPPESMTSFFAQRRLELGLTWICVRICVLVCFLHISHTFGQCICYLWPFSFLKSAVWLLFYYLSIFFFVFPYFMPHSHVPSWCFSPSSFLELFYVDD